MNNAILMPFEIKNVQNKLNEVYFMTQSNIFYICKDIVHLRFFLGSVDLQTYVAYRLLEIHA